LTTVKESPSKAPYSSAVTYSLSHPRQGRKSTISWRRPTAALLLLAGWLVVSGLIWDGLQVMAWGQMLSQNLRSGNWSAAVERTFAEDGKCHLCQTIDSAREEGETLTVVFTGLERPLLLPPRNAALHCQPGDPPERFLEEPRMVIACRFEAPASPPPKAGA